MPEAFEFLVATDNGFTTERYFGLRHYADAHYDFLCARPENLGVYYYAASIPGLVNAYHKPGAVT
jgi:hypothetical protein